MHLLFLFKNITTKAASTTTKTSTGIIYTRCYSMFTFCNKCIFRSNRPISSSSLTNFNGQSIISNYSNSYFNNLFIKKFIYRPNNYKNNNLFSKNRNNIFLINNRYIHNNSNVIKINKLNKPSNQEMKRLFQLAKREKWKLTGKYFYGFFFKLASEILNKNI